MSIFSSLNYLLKRACSVIHQTASTEQPLNAILQEKGANRVSLIVGSESSFITDHINTIYFQDLVEVDNFSQAELNNSFDKWIDLINLPTSKSKINVQVNDTFTTESSFHFSNDTFPDAQHLLESWWNVFDERYLRHGLVWTVTLIIAYMLILVAGVIGNLMVILVVLLRPQMRTVTNMFITNLAIADLLVIMFCVPSTLLANIFAPWILGSFMCKAVAYVQGVAVCASAYSLAAISLDRCQAIYRNYERPRGFSQTVCVRTVFVIWVLAICLTIPWAVIFEVKVSEYNGLRYCVETWKVEEYGNIYFLVVNLTGFYVIPLLLIFVSNWVIYCHVTHRHVPQGSSSAAPIRKLHRQTRRVVLRMLGIVTLTFLLSWLPLYILVIIIKFTENLSESNYNLLGILMPIAQWLGSWNSSINPILYAFLNKKFRRMFKSILPSWIVVKAAGQFEGSLRTPSFTAYTRRSFTKSRTNSKSDYHRHHQDAPTTSPFHATLVVGRFHEHTQTLATTTVQILPKIMPTLLCDSKIEVYETAIIEKNTKLTSETVTDL